MRIAITVLCLAPSVGCVFAPAEPPSGTVLCTSEVDCLVGQVCAASGRCVDPDELDATPPRLVESSLAPDVAGPEDRVTATVAFNETLTGPPTLTLAFGDVRVPMSRGADDVYEVVIADGTPSGTYTLQATAEDLNLNRATVDVGVLDIDTRGPLVLTASLSTDLIGVGAQIEIDATLDESGTLAGRAVERDSGDVIVLVETAPGLLAASAASAGRWDTFVVGTDTQGNVGAERGAGQLVVDGTAPGLDDALVEIAAPTAAFRADVNAATAGSLVRVSFAIDEAAAQTPIVTLDDPAQPIAFVPRTGESRFFSYDVSILETTTEGPLTVTAQVVDAVGNVAALTLGTVLVDRTPPAPPDGLSYRFLRRPWSFDGLDRFVVTGDAGSAALGARVVVVDPADTAAPLAGAAVDALGAARVVLPPVDRARVLVVEVDGAGNPSAPVEVRRIDWVAAFGGKVPGDLTANPHRATLLDGAPRAPRDPTVQLRRELGDVELASADGTEGVVEPQARWRELSRTVPAEPGRPHVTFDPQRGALVAVNAGDPFGPSPPLPLLFDGAQWQELPLPALRPPLLAATVVADIARGKLLLIDGDGASWIVQDGQAVFTGTSPPQRILPRMAYDVDRRVVVMAGGSGSAFLAPPDTWEWDGQGWTEIGGPAPPAGAGAIAFDPVGGGILFYGGEGLLGPVLGETWRYDGAWQQLSPANPPPPRLPISMVSDPDQGRVLAFIRREFQLPPEVRSWDGTDWSTVILPGPPDGGAFELGTAAYDAITRSPVYWGKQQPQIFDGSTWSLVGPTTVAPARFLPALVPDPARGGCLLVGGQTSPNSTLNFRLLGGGFVAAEPFSVAPGAVIAAHDPVRDVIVAVGGGDTWEYAGTWQRILTGGTPALAALAYSPDHATMVAITAADTFTWSGTAWESLGIPGPSQIGGRSLVYDPLSAQLLYFSEGSISANQYIRTHRFTGTQWAAEPLPTQGPFGAGAAVALDDSVGRLVITGGILASKFGGADSFTWEWDGQVWSRLTAEREYPGRAFHASAFVPELGGLVVTGGIGTDVDMWVLERAPRAAVLVEILSAATGLAPETLVAVTPRATMSAAGGAEVQAFVTYPGRFETVAAASGPGAIETRITDATVLRGLRAGPTLAFSLVGNVAAVPLGVDHVEVIVEHVLPPP